MNRKLVLAVGFLTFALPAVAPPVQAAEGPGPREVFLYEYPNFVGNKYVFEIETTKNQRVAWPFSGEGLRTHVGGELRIGSIKVGSGVVAYLVGPSPHVDEPKFNRLYQFEGETPSVATRDETGPGFSFYNWTRRKSPSHPFYRGLVIVDKGDRSAGQPLGIILYGSGMECYSGSPIVAVDCLPVVPMAFFPFPESSYEESCYDLKASISADQAAKWHVRDNTIHWANRMNFSVGSHALDSVEVKTYYNPGCTGMSQSFPGEGSNRLYFLEEYGVRKVASIQVSWKAPPIQTVTGTASAAPTKVRVAAPPAPSAPPSSPLPVVKPPPFTGAFRRPMVGNYRLDYCYHWARECGEPAATAWCRTQGYARASAWREAKGIGSESPTLVLGDERVCDQPVCNGFAEITCAGEGQASGLTTASPAAEPPPSSRTFQRPTVGNYRLDYCYHWARQCGEPAATAWCRTQGYARASAWREAKGIGGESPTLVLGDERVCDQPVCNGFAEITCAGQADR